MITKIRKHTKTLAIIISSSTFPFLAVAATPATPSRNFSEFVLNFINILGDVTMFVAGLGFFGLLTGILKYSGAGGDEERLGKAKQLIIYGLLGMFIIFSFWGLARLLANTYLGVDTF
ncbi:MAG: hypothetical protein V4467_00625 [Patescibacteria group bacterium]